MTKLVPRDAVLIPDQAKRVFEGVVFDVYQWQQPLFDGAPATFEMLRRADTTAVIGIVNDKILVLDDDQPHRGSKLTFPGGRCEPGESPEAAARRETIEETGYEFEHWRLVDVRQPLTKIEWFVYLYVAWGVKGQRKPHLDAGEKIVVKHLSAAETKELAMAKAGFMGHQAGLFAGIKVVEDLKRLPGFEGRTVERPR